MAARNRRLAALQRMLDATIWPRIAGGCRLTRDAETTIAASAFAIERRERFSFRPTAAGAPVAVRILGRARRA